VLSDLTEKICIYAIYSTITKFHERKEVNMKRVLISLFVLLIGFLSVNGFSQNSLVTQVGEWGSGPYVDVFVRGNYAYCAAGGGGIDIININNSSNPVHVACCEASGYVYAVYVFGNYLYAATESGLEIINVSNPNSPTSVGNCMIPGTKYDVIVEGNYAYVANSQLFIIDVSNPSSPFLVGTHIPSKRILDLHVCGNYVYAAMATVTSEFINYYGGLEVIDVSTPSAPTLTASWDFVGYATAVQVKDQYAYVLDWNHGLMIIDGSDPTAPNQVGLFDDWLFEKNIDWEDADLFVDGNYAYVVGDNGGLQIIDISNPTSPTLIGSSDSILYAGGVYVSGNHAYVADGLGGLKIFHTSTPSTPVLAGTFDQNGNLIALHIDGNYAYVLDSYDRLLVINISNPACPTLAGSVDIKTPRGWDDVYVKDNYAYVVDITEGLQVIDISNPSAPTLQGKLESVMGTRVFVYGNYAYLAGIRAGMVVVDISDPSTPKSVEGYDSFITYTVFVKNKKAYTANSSELQIIDVSQPTAPSLLGTCDLSGFPDPMDIFIKDNYAYLVDRFEGLVICDVSDPNNPVKVGSCKTTGRLERVFVNGNYAYIANYDNGLHIIDISNPTSPTLVETCNTPGSLKDVHIDAGYAYLVNGYSGKLFVLQLGTSVLPPGLSVNRSELIFASDSSGTATPPQSFFVSNSGGGTLNWSASGNKNWLNCSPTSGTGSGEVIVLIDSTGLSPGRYNGTITISDPNATNSPRTVTVTLNVYSSGQTSGPFGDFATPTHGSTVRSSVPFTGWVLDDIGVQCVQLFREANGSLVYIGDAVFVEGARPDVQQAYPGYPNNYKAGWGYMMLTNFLPNNGNGIFNIHALATDTEGNQVTLGVKTIICDNANAVKPFGAMDTPTQGGVASGNQFINWGWVLTPQPNSIPTDGSTINVWVDGVNIGHPTYNNYRSDIAGLFPGYANSDGAVGYFYLDTTAYENGVHTIQWTATDDAGNTDGIGSRYFTIGNIGENRVQGAGHSTGKEQAHLFRDSIRDIPIDFSAPIRIKKGYNPNIEPQVIYHDEKGNITVRIKELERLEIHLFNPEEPTLNVEHRALEISSLPIGSTLDARRGVFCWQPSVGFVGQYRFVLISTDHAGNQKKWNIVVNIEPRFSNNKL
jgi:hypothetical protein